MEECPLTGQKVNLLMPIPGKMEYAYETPKTGKVRLTDVALSEVFGLPEEEKNILVGICRNRTIENQDPVLITSAFLKQLHKQDLPKTFEEKSDHFLQFLYDHGGKEYHKHTITSTNDSPIVYSSTKEFDRIINSLMSQGWIETGKETRTNTGTIYHGLFLSRSGIERIEQNPIRLPIIPLSNDERLWLQESYNILCSDKRPTRRTIISNLRSQISQRFDPDSLDERLAHSSGEIIMIPGIIALTKSYEILERADKLLFKLKDLIITDPEAGNFSIAEIATSCNQPPHEAGLIMYLACYYDSFYKTSASEPNGLIVKSISLGNDDRIFEAFYRFHGLEKLILSTFNKKRQTPGISHKEPSKPEFTREVFISHSSADKEVARSIIDLLRSALNLSANEIVCTSVDGFKLTVGAETDHQLRHDIINSKTFIGLISSSSIQSFYVMFELGARWGAELPLLPLVIDNSGSSLLKGPLQNINALNCSNQSDVLKFVEDLAKQLGKTPEQPSVYVSKITDLVRLCQSRG